MSQKKSNRYGRTEHETESENPTVAETETPFFEAEWATEQMIPGEAVTEAAAAPTPAAPYLVRVTLAYRGDGIRVAPGDYFSDDPAIEYVLEKLLTNGHGVKV